MAANKKSAKPLVDRTLTIPLPKWIPTNKNYTVTSDDEECLICQDYSEIDGFARLLTLGKLHDLYSSVDPKQTLFTASTYDATIFDATVLCRSLLDARDSGPLRKEPPKNQAAQKPNPEPLRLKNLFHRYDSIFSTYADYCKSFNKNANQLKSKFSAYDKVERSYNMAEKAGDTESANFLYESLLQLNSEQKKLSETMDVEADIWKFMLEREVQKVELLAIALWQALIKAKVTKGYDPRVDDPVLRARLFFAWLGYSISYDKDLTKQAERGEDMVRYVGALYTGKEICGGYAGLFKVMFDATSPGALGENGFARSMDGRHRLYGDPQSKPWNSDQPGHGWNTFPVSDRAGLEHPFKVIDVTGGALFAPRQLNSIFWSMTNASFLQTHIPRNLEAEAKGDYLYLLPLETQRECGYPNVMSQDLWTRSQPRSFAEGQMLLMEWIDRGTIDPSDSNIPATVTLNDATVQFRNSCRHQAGKAPKFFLKFIEEKGDFEKLKARNFDTEGASLFVQHNDQLDRRPLWKSTVQIPKGKEGFVVMFSVNPSRVQRILAWKYDSKATATSMPFARAKL